ncbi:MAG: hypothetical protein HYS09_04060 [Chloroflexi bacterium]|nr:hypothetical protein [Chloroflexota bacterium]
MADKLQREIEELLDQLEDFPPRRSPWAWLRSTLSRVFAGLRRGFSTPRLPRLSIGHLLLASVVLIIVAYVFSPGGDSGGRILIGAALLIFVVAFVLSLRRQGRIPEKRWRGQPMEVDSSGMGSRLRSWWERWRGRR